MYHYTGCGLNNIWLRNGYEVFDTPYGEGVSVADLDGLHRAIGLFLIEHNLGFSGAEIRFLRTEIDLSQRDLAAFLGVSENTIRGWENDRQKITGPSDRMLRLLYKDAVEGNIKVRHIIEHISQLNQDVHREKLELEQTQQGWREAA